MCCVSIGKTHCGVIEFVAQEGTVGLPKKAQASLAVETVYVLLMCC